MSNQSVRALNNGDTEFKAMYDGVQYKIPAHSELIIPWDAAILWLGDPRLWDAETDRARTKERDRLMVRWGAIEGVDLADRLPNIAIHLLSDGSPIPMLGADPSAPPIDVFGSGAEEDMSQDQRMSHLEQQLAEAIARLNELTANQAPADPSINSQPPSPATISQPTITPPATDDLPTDGEVNPPVPVGAPTATPATPATMSTLDGPPAPDPTPTDPSTSPIVQQKLAEIAARREAANPTPSSEA